MRRCAAFVLVTTALLTAGCGGATREDAGSGPESAASAALEANEPAVTQGTFAAYRAGAPAVTYNSKLVPAGSWARLSIAEIADSTTISLTVNGLLPNREYGAHLHTMSCGQAPAAAGPHYQHVPDPAASASPPSVNPAYANPQNEVWLDFSTDSQGAALSKSIENWRFSAKPRSLVIHAETTKTTPGKAGTAGPRLACLTLST